MASGSGWNIWVWLTGGVCLVGVVVRRYIDFLILLIPIYSSCIYICSFSQQQHPYFLFIFKCFSFFSIGNQP